MNGKQNVLFVDDDSHLLSGLQRMLRGMRDEWEMTFTLGGREAIKKIQGQCFDVVVTDMRMPEVDGVEVLKAVRDLCPKSVRVVLSGQAEQGSIFQALSQCHQYYAKPCNAIQLQTSIKRACTTRHLIGNSHFRKVVGGISCLPSIPQNIRQLEALLSGDDSALHELEALISSDAAIGAKVLQLANSTLFGRNTDVIDIKAAVRTLGLDFLTKCLDKSAIFSSAEDTWPVCASAIQAHVNEVAAIAENFALQRFGCKHRAGVARTAGLLHEVGRIILIQADPAGYAEVLSLIRSEQISSTAAELSMFGVTHAEIGGYLLSLWGIPSLITNAITYHRVPSSAPCEAIEIAQLLSDANEIAGEAYLINSNNSLESAR